MTSYSLTTTSGSYDIDFHVGDATGWFNESVLSPRKPLMEWTLEYKLEYNVPYGAWEYKGTAILHHKKKRSLIQMLLGVCK